MSATTPQRRSFLAALSAFVATPAALAAAPAIAARVEPAEAPELLAPGEELRTLLATYREAASRLASAREHYERIKPVPPAELIVPAGNQWLTDPLSDREREIDGTIVPPRRIYDRRSLQVHIIAQDVPRTTREGRRLRRLARLAKAYEAAKEAAAREAGYWEADEVAGDVTARLAGLTHRLLQVEPKTLAGARILAEACAGLWEARDRLGAGAHTHTSTLGLHLAGALLRITGGPT